MKEHWYDGGRIGAISDGVFAIAMTLLVLDLKLPEIEVPLSHNVFAEAILAQVPHFLSWIISFTILCRLWLTQHNILDGGEKKSRGFTTVNFVFLGVISFIPFPTSLVSVHPEQPLSIIIFSSTYVAAGLALAGMWFMSEKGGERTDIQQAGNRSVRRVLIGVPVLALISCLLALVEPRLSIAVWVVLPFVGISIRRHKAYHV